MTDARTACPDWLDDEATAEWLRRIDSDRIDHRHRETLAVFSFVFSLRQRVCRAGEILKNTADDDTSVRERQRLLTVISGIETRLAWDLYDLSTALGISTEGRGEPRPTRILILDEGASDGAE